MKRSFDNGQCFFILVSILCLGLLAFSDMDLTALFVGIVQGFFCCMMIVGESLLTEIRHLTELVFKLKMANAAVFPPGHIIKLNSGDIVETPRWH